MNGRRRDPHPARVLTQDEVLALPMGAVVWLETSWNDEEGCGCEIFPYAAFRDDQGLILFSRNDFGSVTENSFTRAPGEKVRWWSAMPTDEQRAQEETWTAEGGAE